MKKSIISLAILSTLTSFAGFANQAGDIIVRAGITSVAPDNDEATVFAGGNTVHLNATSPAFKVNVDDNAQLGLNLAYFLTDNIAVELLAATPFSHDINVDVGATEALLATTKHLPPTVSALYYFNDTDSKFQPYVGVGLNYTVFFEDQFESAMKGDAVQVGGLNGTAVSELAGALGLPEGTESVGLRAKDLKLKNSFGLAFQAGIDYHIDEKWLVNASVRYIDIETEASFKATALEIDGTADVTIDPMVYTVSIGYKF